MAAIEHIGKGGGGGKRKVSLAVGFHKHVSMYLPGLPAERRRCCCVWSWLNILFVCLQNKRMSSPNPQTSTFGSYVHMLI